jgi:hypothetical protein
MQVQVVRGHRIPDAADFKVGVRALRWINGAGNTVTRRSDNITED